jgi:HrpA-like RNA helicase
MGRYSTIMLDSAHERTIPIGVVFVFLDLEYNPETESVGHQ